MAAPNTYEGTYGKPVRLDVEVPAEMLESVAGFEDGERVDRELTFALSAASVDDPDSLRWIAAILDRKLITEV